MVFEAACKATAIGSVPHTDVDAACSLVFDNLKQIPIWPQLPNLSFKESITVQYSEGMPGIVVDEAERHVSFQTNDKMIEELDRLFTAFLQDDIEAFAISRSYAEGLYRFLELLQEKSFPDIECLKGHIVGPLTLGLTVTDENKIPSLYNDMLREGIIKTLALKAKFQIKRFKEVRPDLPGIIFIDDPYIMSIGSGFVNLNREDVIGYLNEIIDQIDGFSGIHCCGNTDWGVLAETNTDIISFDAYEYSEALALYPVEIKRFLAKGGIIAWGIVPSGLPTPEQVTLETRDSLLEKLEAGMQMLINQGIDKEVLLNQSLITPNCGTGTMQPHNAERTFILSREISEIMRSKYF